MILVLCVVLGIQCCCCCVVCDDLYVFVSSTCLSLPPHLLFTDHLSCVPSQKSFVNAACLLKDHLVGFVTIPFLSLSSLLFSSFSSSFSSTSSSSSQFVIGTHYILPITLTHHILKVNVQFLFSSSLISIFSFFLPHSVCRGGRTRLCNHPIIKNHSRVKVAGVAIWTDF